MSATLQKTVKLFCFTCLLLINKNILTAQSLAIYGGLSVPVGLYGSKDITLKDAGFAKPGANFMATFEDNRKPKWFNYKVLGMYNNNGIDAEAIERFVNTNANNRSKVNIQAISAWQQTFLGAGPTISLNRSKYSLQAELMFGINWLQSAAYNQFDSVNFIKQKELNATSLGILAAMGSNILITEGLHFAIKTGFYYTNADYGDVVLTNANGIVIPLANQQRLQVPVQLLMLNFGLVFNLQHPKKNLKIE